VLKNLFEIEANVTMICPENTIQQKHYRPTNVQQAR